MSPAVYDSAHLSIADEVEGVVPGAGRGADLEFPTANLLLENDLVPCNGVYVTETVVLAGRHPSMTNVGVRPTFGGTDITVESHLLDFSGDLYGERAEVRFLARIRDERQFPDGRELAATLAAAPSLRS